MSGYAAPRRDYTAGVKAPVCANCASRRMILMRTDHQDRTCSYHLRCADCDRVTRAVPTLKQVVELAEWLPLAMVEA